MAYSREGFDLARFAVRVAINSDGEGHGLHASLWPPLFGGIAQNCFQGDAEIAPHLGHGLIAILTKRRWLIIFQSSPALLVLKLNYQQPRVECSGELMAGHL